MCPPKIFSYYVYNVETAEREEGPQDKHVPGEQRRADWVPEGAADRRENQVRGAGGCGRLHGVVQQQALGRQAYPDIYFREIVMV